MSDTDILKMIESIAKIHKSIADKNLQLYNESEMDLFPLSIGKELGIKEMCERILECLKEKESEINSKENKNRYKERTY